ncbi:MAG: hypothetical protein J6W82_01640 [Bacteroidales bacterium]|nr:hypothetical protein [Bacteroidales bacterium]
MNTKQNYSAPSAEMLTVRFEAGFLGLSNGAGTATGENMTVTADEEW